MWYGATAATCSIFFVSGDCRRPMAAFSAEQQLLRMRAQNDPACEPYPLSVPVSWAASSDNQGRELEPGTSETATSQDAVPPVGPPTGPAGEPRPSETTTSQDVGSPVGPLTGPAGGVSLTFSAQDLPHIPVCRADVLHDFPPSPPPASILFRTHELQECDLESEPEQVAGWSPASLPDGSQHTPHMQDVAAEEARYYRQVAETEDGLDFSEFDEQLRSLDHRAPPLQLGPKSFPIALPGRNALEPSSRVDIAARVSDELISRPSLSKLKFPWERGPMKTIFSDANPNLPELPKMPLAAKKLLMPQESVPSAPASGKDLPKVTYKPTVPGAAIYSLAIRVTRNISFKARREDVLEVSVEKLIACMRLMPVNYIPVALAHDGRVDRESVSASVGNRSPWTIAKRASSLSLFLRWFHMSESPDAGCMEEGVIWSYVVHLRRSGAAASRGSGFLSALRFLHHVLGFGLEEVLRSRRVCGLAEQMSTGVHWLRQAEALTLGEVRRLHSILEDCGAHSFDRALAARCLIALYGRCRNSDLSDIQWIEHEFSDSAGYLVLYLGLHKSNKAAARSKKLLPVLIPAMGITGQQWVSQAIAALEAVGMSVEGKISGPLLPAPLSADAANLSEREIRASEITSFLRIALKSVCGEERLKRISSHSLKRTPLAWCAKFGVSEPVRSVLGRHVSATAGSQAIYAVDLATSAVKEFEGVLSSVSGGTFNPDNPRADYFVSTVQEQPSTSLVGEVKAEVEFPEVPAPPSALIVVESDSESSSASSSSSTGSSSEDEAPPVKVSRSEWPWALSKALMHAKSKKCHYIMARSGGGNAILACGKVGSGNYVAPASFDQVNGTCQNCRRVVAGL